ncbi:putative N-acetyl-LL-diaminopimelate aminotransferase [compost metagenome]
MGATDELEGYKASCQANRDFLQQRLPQLGFSLLSPMDGAFYAYADVGAFTNDSMEFAYRMLADIDVAATPGRDFDPLDGHRAMRFSYAGSMAEMVAATDRIAAWLKR